MAFAPSFLDELRARLPVSEVVGRKVKLQRRGREHTGLCPFHTEKTPSFTVNDDKGFYHCFGCGEHGSVIDFIMKVEGLPFPEAIERLAAQAGLAVPERSPRDREQEARQASLHEVVETAAAWFESQLAGMAGARARDYLSERGLRPETVKRFRLGLAPDGRTALKDALVARGINEALLLEAGLVIKPEDGGDSYDRFRNRVMFPIWDRRGRVIAFGGRALGEARAKYLNSPETQLFHKGNVLYGLHLAREKAREAGTVIVAEGYMDVIALAAAGFEHAVAPLGTALTERQMEELWRLAPEPVVCMDGDTAGLRAAARAAERCLPLLKPGHSLRFAQLPEGQDPDDLIRRRGSGTMAEVLEAAVSLADLIWQMETRGRAVDTPERRAALQEALMGLVGQIGDQRVQHYYRQHYRDRLRQAFQTSSQPANKWPRNADRQRDWARSALRGGDRLKRTETGLSETESARRERVLVTVILNHPEILEAHLEGFAALDFADGQMESLKTAILDVAADNPGLDTGKLKAHLADRGFASAIKRLTGPDSGFRDRNRHREATYRFALPDATVEQALLLWTDIVARHQRDTVQAELNVVEEELGRAPTEETWKRFLSLQSQLRTLDSTAVDLDGSGDFTG